MCTTLWTHCVQHARHIFLTILPTTVVCSYRNDAYFLLCSGLRRVCIHPTEKDAIVRLLFKRAFGAEAKFSRPMLRKERTVV